ncbi:MAG TPA: acyltransferase domain-containing protein [Actinokineospora sp.]|nr:acyltransferase domain-containing protein [Actinokineospora sp.]
MTQTVFLLGGQGAYLPGMFAGDATLDEPLVVIDSVAAEFGHPGVRPLLTDPAAPAAAVLAQSDPLALQLAVFAAAVGDYRKAAVVAVPDVLVGHSLGELAALTAAGGFDLADAARLVCLRTNALLENVTVPGGLIAVELSERRARHVVGTVDDRRLAVGVINAPTWTVLSGPTTALDVARTVAEGLGARVVTLPAPFAFHSPGLALAASSFALAAANTEQRPLRTPVYSPLLGEYVTDSMDFVSLLVGHLTSPVDFLAAVRALHVDGMRRVVECGRGGLSALVRATVPGVETEGGRSASPATPEPVTERAAAVPADIGTVVERLRELYASTLGYPVEAVDAEADLEADLGIDSLKRAEMLGKVGAEFGLSDSVNSGRFLAHSSLSELAKMIGDTLAGSGAGR